MDESDVADFSKSLLTSFPVRCRFMFLKFCILTTSSKFQSRLYRCLLFATLCVQPLVVKVAVRIGRSTALRPQDLETRYWIRAPYNGFCRSVRDITSTSLTVDRFPFGNNSEALRMTYTIFYLDQVAFSAVPSRSLNC